MEKTVYLYIGEGFADFEPAIAIDMISKTNTAIPKKREYEIMTFGREKTPVKSLAGLTVIPKKDFSGVDISAAAMIILPGTIELMTSDIPEMTNLVTDCRKNNIPVAAICGATVFLAKIGCLDTIRHTSNGPGYLKMMAPGYRGERNYVHAPCISDRGIITANPFGHEEFAREIFRSLDLMAPEVLEVVYQGYRKGYVDFDRVPGQPQQPV